MLETSLTNKIRKKLNKEVGGFWIKIHGGPQQRRGLPDLHGTVEGLSFWIEIKVPGKNPTELQNETMKKIRDEGGGVSFWTTSEEYAVMMVKKYLKRRSS